MNKNILVIEDDDEIRMLIKEMLEFSGYTIEEAVNGKLGVECALKSIPAAILCDIMMPVMDGFSVLYMLKQNSETVDIPFIFLTSKAERGDYRRGMEMGADDFITKPFKDGELLNALESRLKIRNQQINRNLKTRNKIQNILCPLDGLIELKKIAKEFKGRLFKKNQVIYYEGDASSGLYWVISGKIKTIKVEELGRELTTSIYGSDEFVGIHAILSNENYTETAVALEDSWLSLISKEKLDQAILLHPEISRQFIRLLSQNIREKENQLLELAYHSVRKRVAESILKLYRGDENQKKSFKISREDLAAMAGVAAETVSRTLTDFKDMGIIDKKGSYISILNLEGLSKVKN